MVASEISSTITSGQDKVSMLAEMDINASSHGIWWRTPAKGTPQRVVGIGLRGCGELVDFRAFRPQRRVPRRQYLRAAARGQCRRGGQANAPTNVRRRSRSGRPSKGYRGSSLTPKIRRTVLRTPSSAILLRIFAKYAGPEAPIPFDPESHLAGGLLTIRFGESFQGVVAVAIAIQKVERFRAYSNPSEAKASRRAASSLTSWMRRNSHRNFTSEKS
ncbi:hypothetical protein EDB81DRAFT_922307 [Dactylonectria macrodidyma]|uniref:Uncharacterized protein n=1 Tax=Dactylonectria macrodidyma TaxID=307937 RepID=A0A9P9I9S6_9HYPO|nr:hypothetical protein EDB81DRAFT_922307 [Dactylonectria macrodidyma]